MVPCLFGANPHGASTWHLLVTIRVSIQIETRLRSASTNGFFVATTTGANTQQPAVGKQRLPPPATRRSNKKGLACVLPSVILARFSHLKVLDYNNQHTQRQSEIVSQPPHRNEESQLTSKRTTQFESFVGCWKKMARL